MKTIEEAVASEQIRAEVKFEYDVLKSIAEVISKSGEPRLCAINPIGYLFELNALVTEEIRLFMLKEHLTKIQVMMGSKKNWDDFVTQLRLAGKWLKTIHTSFSTQKETALQNLDVFEKISGEIDHLEGKNARSLDLLRVKFKSLYNLILNEKIPMSAAHDDYHLGNIFVTDEGKVGVLDPNWKDDRPIYGDLSKLLIDPPTRKMQVAFHGLSFRPSLRTAYEREILSEYLGDNSFSESVLWLYCAYATLQKWNNNEEILNGGLSRPLSVFRPFILIYVRHYFLNLIRDYLNRGIRMAS
jgi:thiamine kinase-like enzyme